MLGTILVVGAALAYIAGCVSSENHGYDWAEEEKKERSAKRKINRRAKKIKCDIAAGLQILCGNLKRSKWTVIVDSNIFCNAVTDKDKLEQALFAYADGYEESYQKRIINRFHEYLRSSEFFDVIEENGLVVSILTSQLNEIANFKRSRNKSKQRLASGAQKIIERLQGDGLIRFLDNVQSTRKSYADPEIMKTALKIMKRRSKVFVLTEDRDLRIRLKSVGVLCKSLKELS